MTEREVRYCCSNLIIHSQTSQLYSYLLHYHFWDYYVKLKDISAVIICLTPGIIYLWSMYGICVRYLWNMYGCIRYVWNIYGIPMAYVWNMSGIRVE